MGYQILPNLIFLLSILALIAIVLKKLPEAVELEERIKKMESAEEKLAKKGLPIIAFSFFKEKSKFWTKKIWQYALEAKDLKPGSVVGYKIRKLFGYIEVTKKTQSPIDLPLTELGENFRLEQETTEELLNTEGKEKEILASIKAEPKNYRHYDNLGKLYIEKENFTDARDVYLYLVNHESGHSEYYARLGYCLFKLKNYEQASEQYRKSISLDSTHPNRYYNLGLCDELMQKYSDAVASFQKALELEPQNTKYLQALNRVLSKQEINK